jgi:DNA-binding response OmpR family regulator
MVHAVLIVEDDADLRAMMDQLLHLEGFAPITAPNGREALKLLKAGAPARVILLDLMMPIMDGWAFRREQRRDPAIADIPVIVLSAVDQVSSAELDAVTTFRKPLNFTEVVECIRSVCDQVTS